jgi:acyl dehydratase
MICDRAQSEAEMPVSLGYDRLRFLRGVRLGDTITVTYTVTDTDADRRRAGASIEITNQAGETVAAGRHILKWVPVPAV